MRRYFLNLHPLRRNIALLLIHNGLQSLIFVIPVIIPYYHDVIGLSFREFLLGEIVFSAVVILMEVPAGWLADTGQRRLVLMAGSLIEMAGFGLWLHADNFTETLAAQGSLGIGVSLVNGTNTALLFDTLKQYRRQKHFRRIEGLRQGMGFYCVGCSSLAGGFLYAVDPRLPLTLSLLTFLLAGIAAFLMVEPARARRAERKHPVRDVVATIHYAVHGHPAIGALVLFCGIMFGTTQAGFWTQQPYYMARSIPEHWFGLLAFTGFMLAGLASQHGHRLERHIPIRSVFISILAAVSGSYAICGFAPGLWAVPFLYTASIAYGFAMPLIQDIINHRIESDRRAGVISTASLSQRLFFIPIGATVAQASALYGIDATVAGIGIFLAFSGSLAIAVLIRHGVLADGIVDGAKA